eukprot:1342110-Pleurochrysis_carterae.AAC.1
MGVLSLACRARREWRRGLPRAIAHGVEPLRCTGCQGRRAVGSMRNYPAMYTWLWPQMLKREKTRQTPRPRRRAQCVCECVSGRLSAIRVDCGVVCEQTFVGETFPKAKQGLALVRLACEEEGAGIGTRVGEALHKRGWDE